MKKSTAFSSLLLLGSFGSLSYLAAKVVSLSLHFTLDGEDDHHHYC